MSASSRPRSVLSIYKTIAIYKACTSGKQQELFTSLEKHLLKYLRLSVNSNLDKGKEIILKGHRDQIIKDLGSLGELDEEDFEIAETHKETFKELESTVNPYQQLKLELDLLIVKQLKEALESKAKLDFDSEDLEQCDTTKQQIEQFKKNKSSPIKLVSQIRTGDQSSRTPKKYKDQIDARRDAASMNNAIANNWEKIINTQDIGAIQEAIDVEFSAINKLLFEIDPDYRRDERIGFKIAFDDIMGNVQAIIKHRIELHTQKSDYEAAIQFLKEAIDQAQKCFSSQTNPSSSSSFKENDAQKHKRLSLSELPKFLEYLKTELSALQEQQKRHAQLIAIENKKQEIKQCLAEAEAKADEIIFRLSSEEDTDKKDDDSEEDIGKKVADINQVIKKLRECIREASIACEQALSLKNMTIHHFLEEMQLAEIQNTLARLYFEKSKCQYKNMEYHEAIISLNNANQAIQAARSEGDGYLKKMIQNQVAMVHHSYGIALCYEKKYSDSPGNYFDSSNNNVKMGGIPLIMLAINLLKQNCAANGEFQDKKLEEYFIAFNIDLAWAYHQYGNDLTTQRNYHLAHDYFTKADEVLRGISLAGQQTIDWQNRRQEIDASLANNAPLIRNQESSYSSASSYPIPLTALPVPTAPQAESSSQSLAENPGQTQETRRVSRNLFSPSASSLFSSNPSPLSASQTPFIENVMPAAASASCRNPYAVYPAQPSYLNSAASQMGSTTASVMDSMNTHTNTSAANTNDRIDNDLKIDFEAAAALFNGTFLTTSDNRIEENNEDEEENQQRATKKQRGS